MRKFIAGFGIFGVILYVYYLVSGANNSSNFIDWIQAQMTRLSLKVNSLTGGYINKALSLVSGLEGFSSRAYADPPGQTELYSIGYGHQINGTNDGLSTSSVISEEQGLQLLSSDIAWADECVQSSVDVPLNDNQRAALISLAYNIGCPNFSGSTLVKILNQGDYAGASDQFQVWRKAGGVVNAGLVARRQTETEVFNS